jgi:hypothetical protein
LTERPDDERPQIGEGARERVPAAHAAASRTIELGATPGRT